MTGPDKRARLNFRFIAPHRPKLCPLAPMVRSALPPHIHKQLARIEPGAQFKGGLPQVLSSSGRSYYAKTGSQRDIGPYVTEVESLKAISLAAPGLVPTLLAFGFADEDGREADSSRGSPYFITEYKYMTPLTERSAAILGRRLGAVCRCACGRFVIHVRGKRWILRPVPKGAGHKSEVGLQYSFCDHSSSFEKGDTRSPPPTSD